MVTVKPRKQTEITYYDQAAKGSVAGEAGSRMHTDPLSLESYQYLQETVHRYGNGKKILDYGCDIGV